MPSRSVRAILFDLDGTLRNSAHAIMPSVEYAFQAHGLPVPDVADMRKHAHSIRSVHKAFATEIAFEEFLAAYDMKLQEVYSQIVLYEGTEALLNTLREQGYRLAIVSSARRAQTFLDNSGVVGTYFEVVVGGNDTTEHKPSPEPVELALKKLQLQPEQVIMVGDLAADIMSGQAAGVRATVGITHGFGDRQMLEEAKADYIIDSLEDFPPLLSKIEQN